MDKDDYTIVVSETKEKLIEKVNILVRIGWYAIGAAFKEDEQWHQTMMRYKNIDDDNDDDEGDDDNDDDDPKTPGGGPSQAI